MTCVKALYVANSGRAFTRKGVIGICASHLSEKTGIRSDDYECEDKDLTSCIREREITTYQNDRNRVESDAHGEQEISHDYDGRFAWELLQNADDVMGSTGRQPAELIGTKGLGFKSVLEITEEPEIHSGLFNFKFSPNETQKLLKCKNIHENPPRLTFVGGNSGEIGTDVRDRPDGTGAPVGNGKTRTSDPRPETGLDAGSGLGSNSSVFNNRCKKVHEGSVNHVEAKHVETRPGSIHWSRDK